MGEPIGRDLFDGVELTERAQAVAESLVGIKAREASRTLSQRMQELLADGRYDERNELVPLARHISENADYGVREGDQARYRFSPNTIRTGEVLRIEGGRAEFRGVRVPLSLVLPAEPEQLSLFEEG